MIKHWPLFLLVFLLAACNPASPNEPEQSTTAPVPPATLPAQPSDLPNLGEAPELTNEVWLNTPAALRLANLRGQVVLLEMWTYG